MQVMCLCCRRRRTVCDYLIVCIQSDPSADREAKNSPIQSIVERQIQVSACKYADQVVVYNTEADVLEILKSVDWDVRILGDEYENKEFTGRDISFDKCYFNRRPHEFSSSSLRMRVVNGTKEN